MSSSDEEQLEFPLVKYGTPFEDLEEETLKKPIAVHEQIVTDEQGRRRFHGAFTGGFSAGYYNSVDTKGGWKPSSFRSSRSDRSENRAYIPEDFMDDEDVSEFGIAPKKIVPQSSFKSAQTTDQNTCIKRKENFAKNATMLLGFDMLQSLIIPISNNIGVKLVQSMGWKPGEGIGVRVKRPSKQNVREYLPENVTFAPEDCVPMEFTAKDDVFGLAYTSMNPKQALHEKVKMSSAITSRTKSGGKLSFAGQAFGVGAYEEEDQDIYAQDSIANYDLIMNDEKLDDAYGWSKPTRAITGTVLEKLTYTEKVLEQFVMAGKLIRRKIYPSPLLPPDFIPHKRLKLRAGHLKTGLHSHPMQEHYPELDDKQLRSQGYIERTKTGLGGKCLQTSDLSSDAKSVFSLLSTQDRNRLEKIKHGANSQPLSPGTSIEPLALEPLKQSRYKQYVELLKKKERDPYAQIKHDSNITEWDREQEKEEFEKLSRFFQPLSATMASRFAPESEDFKQQNAEEEEMRKAAKMKLFGIMTRKEAEWHPDSLLCTRFNVPNPYSHSNIVGIPGKDGGGPGEVYLHPDDFKRAKNKLHERCTLNKKSNETRIISDTKSPPVIIHTSKPTRWDKSASQQQSVELVNHKPISSLNRDAIEKPSRDLFKAIFDGDTSEEEDQPGTTNDLTPPDRNGIQQIESVLNVNQPQYHTFSVKHDHVATSGEVFGPAPPRVKIAKVQAPAELTTPKRKKTKHKKHKHKKARKL